MKKRNYPNGDFISGFGGGYEIACQKMVLVGLDWLDNHPDANPTFDQYKDIYGITSNENDDMKAMQDAMLIAEPHCSVAMMQACTNHIIFIHKNGWDEYLEKITEKQKP